MNLTALDIAVLLVYFVGLAVMGVYFARRTAGTSDYFVGGGTFKGWVVGLSLVGTSISSISFLAFPGDAYKTAYLRMLPNFMLPVALVAAAYVFLPFYRKNRIVSAYEYLGMRFGPGIRIYGSVTFIIGQLMRTSLVLYLLSVLIQSITDLEAIPCILVAGVFVAFYTIVGGMKAVMWTDVIQTVVLAMGGLLCLGVVIYLLPGGLGQVFHVGGAAGKFSFAEYDAVAMKLKPARWDVTLQSKTATMMLLLGLTNWLYEYSSIQYTVQRYAAARSAHDARVAMWVAALCSIPIWLFFMFLGTALYVFYQTFPTEATTEMLTGARDAEQVLPYFIVHQLPSGLSGLVIAAAAAAAMSSLDSSINSVATVGVIDIYRRHLVPNRDDRHYLRVARWISAITGVLMIFGAIWFSMAESKTLQDTSTKLTSILAGGLFGLFMFGMLTTRGDGRAAGCGIVCTLLFTTWTVLVDMGLLPSWLSVPFDAYYTTIIGNLVMFAVGYGLGLLLFPNKKPLADLTIWTYNRE